MVVYAGICHCSKSRVSWIVISFAFFVVTRGQGKVVMVSIVISAISAISVGGWWLVVGMVASRV